jgi:hypothetical protein
MVFGMRRKAFRMTPSYRILDVIVADNASSTSREQSATDGFETVIQVMMTNDSSRLKLPEFGRLE